MPNGTSPWSPRSREFYRTLDNIPDLLEIAKCHSEKGLIQESDDESGGWCRKVGPTSGHSRDLRYSNTRQETKRRNNGRTDFVANSSYGPRDPKNYRRELNNPRGDEIRPRRLEPTLHPP